LAVSLHFEGRSAFLSFAVMKRVFAGILCASVLATTTLRGADAVALAAQQEAEERYKRLNASVEELQAAQLALQKQFSALATEVGKLRDEVARANNNTSTQDAIRKLNDQILKVDDARVADNKRIQEALEKLAKALREMPAAPPPRPRVAETVPAPAPSSSNGSGTAPRATTGSGVTVEDGFEYTIQSGDRLDKIVQRCREEKIMVTMKMVRDANPNVDWNRLRIGQKIFIPKPK
jgi:LysM repeat protein